MRLEEVKLTKVQQVAFVSKALYDFLPLRLISFFMTYVTSFMIFVGPHMTEKDGTHNPLLMRLFIATMSGVTWMILLFVILPMVYKDFIVDVLYKGFKQKLRFHQQTMQKKVLEQTDEIILQQKRK